MARTDRLTYDVGQQIRRRLRWPSLLLLAAVLVGAPALFGWVLVASRTPQGAPGPVAPVTVTPSPSAVAGSPLPSGSDAGEEQTVPEGSEQVSIRFVRAWLDRNPKTRRPALDQLSAPALAEELMLTDPANIPRARPRGGPVLEYASAYSAQFTQALSTGLTIQVYLVTDPQARYGWLATSVERA